MTCFWLRSGLEGLRPAVFPGEGGRWQSSSLGPKHDNGPGFHETVGSSARCSTACHATPMIRRLRSKGLTDGVLPYVTAGLEVRYLRANPTAGTMELTRP